MHVIGRSNAVNSSVTKREKTQGAANQVHCFTNSLAYCPCPCGRAVDDESVPEEWVVDEESLLGAPVVSFNWLLPAPNVRHRFSSHALGSCNCFLPTLSVVVTTANTFKLRLATMAVVAQRLCVRFNAVLSTFP